MGTLKPDSKLDKKESSFRGDIQGLRAIAVLAVVLFHLGPSRLPGGFIGVDMFFVVSGYLIIGHVWRDLNKENFGLLTFYSKRIKRLFPAFFATAIATTLFGYFFLLPNELDRFAKSLVASLFYSSNFFFYSVSDYFNSDLHLSPLLHTWSLGVEEQFYFVFPLLLVFIFKKKASKIFGILIVLTIASFLLSELLVHVDSNAAFYFSISRFWQFIVGGILSIQFKDLKLSRIKSDVLSALGLGMIGVSFFLITKKTPFPGIGAIVPTLATVMLLLAGNNRESLHYKLLSLRPLRFFGDISYSLYLWHWPVIVYYKLAVNGTPALKEKGVLLLVSIVLGYLSWKFIEQNASIKKIPLQSRFPIKVSFGLSIVFTFLIFLMTQIDGRFTPEQVRYASYLGYDHPHQCLAKNSKDGYPSTPTICIDVENEKPKVILIGDSHAAHWYWAMRAQLAPNTRLSLVSHSGCKPTVAYKGKKICTDANRWAFEKLLPKEHFDKVILSARWRKQDLKGLMKTIEKLKPLTKEIVVMGPIVEYSMALPRLLATQKDAASLAHYREYGIGKKRDQRFKKAVEKTGSTYLSVFDTICPSEETCLTTTEEDEPLQFDYGHLTHEGSAFILDQLK